MVIHYNYHYIFSNNLVCHQYIIVTFRLKIYILYYIYTGVNKFNLIKLLDLNFLNLCVAKNSKITL